MQPERTREPARHREDVGARHRIDPRAVGSDGLEGLRARHAQLGVRRGGSDPGLRHLLFRRARRVSAAESRDRRANGMPGRVDYQVPPSQEGAATSPVGVAVSHRADAGRRPGRSLQDALGARRRGTPPSLHVTSNGRLPRRRAARVVGCLFLVWALAAGLSSCSVSNGSFLEHDGHECVDIDGPSHAAHPNTDVRSRLYCR